MEILERLMAKIYKFTAVVDKAVLLSEIIPFGVYTEENVQWATQMLAACRQQEIYVRLIFLVV